MPGLMNDEIGRLVITDELVYIFHKDEVRVFPRAERFCYAEVLRIPTSSGKVYLYLQMKYLDRPRLLTFLPQDSWGTLSEWLESIGCNTCLDPEHLGAVNTGNISHVGLDGSDEVMIDWKDGTRELFSSTIVSKYKIPVK